MPTIDYDDLEMAFLSTDDYYLLNSATYICRKSGKTYYLSDDYESEDEMPDNLEDANLYALVPGQQDLNLGKHLVFKFAAQSLPENYDQIETIFRRRGAYRRYKELLSECGKLDEWYKFEESARKEKLTEWAKSEGFTLS